MPQRNCYRRKHKKVKFIKITEAINIWNNRVGHIVRLVGECESSVQNRWAVWGHNRSKTTKNGCFWAVLEDLPPQNLESNRRYVTMHEIISNNGIKF